MHVLPPVLPTIGEIARRTGYPVHRVEYVIRTRDIKPVGRAGTARIFSDSDVQYIASEMRRIDEDKATA
jgi:DNA-binding transcriptional MerR regulator